MTTWRERERERARQDLGFQSVVSESLSQFFLFSWSGVGGSRNLQDVVCSAIYLHTKKCISACNL